MRYSRNLEVIPETEESIIFEDSNKMLQIAERREYVNEFSDSLYKDMLIGVKIF